MEKIQKAIDKAKRRQEQVTPTQRTTDQGAPQSTECSVPVAINYSQTRVVRVSDRVLEENRIIASIEGHPYADLFRVLRTKVLHTMRQANLNSLAITSPTKGGGKSLISANLAIAIAMEINQTVMLVDLDLRSPSLHQYFDIEPQKGLADYLLNEAVLSEMLIHPGIERLVLLPVGRALPQSSELLSTPRMKNLIDDITHRYASRVIIFDLPPLLGQDDALTLLPSVHASLLVVEEGGNTREEIEQSMHLLENTNLLGAVYNKAKMEEQSPY